MEAYEENFDEILLFFFVEIIFESRICINVPQIYNIEYYYINWKFIQFFDTTNQKP